MNVILDNRICRRGMDRIQRNVHPFDVLVARLCLFPVFVVVGSAPTVLEQFKLGVPSSTDLAIIELEMIKMNFEISTVLTLY